MTEKKTSKAAADIDEEAAFRCERGDLPRNKVDGTLTDEGRAIAAAGGRTGRIKLANDDDRRALLGK